MSSEKSHKVYHTIVVGMGAAGAVAASKLAKAKKSVLALEATKRWGGRVTSVSVAEGTVEPGAEWIYGTINNVVYEAASSRNLALQFQDMEFEVYRSHGQTEDHRLLNELAGYCIDTQFLDTPRVNKPYPEFMTKQIHGTKPSIVFDAAKSCRIPLQEQELDFKVYRSDGGQVDQKLMNELVEYCLEVQLGPEAPDRPEPLGEFVTRKLNGYLAEKHPAILKDQVFIEEFLQFMNLLVDNYEACNDWNDVSAWSKYEEIEGHQHVSWHKLGYKTFFDIVLNTYNNGPGLPKLETKLGCEVTQIKWPKQPKEYCAVTCKDGSVYRAENVIVTVSLGVLKERHTTLFSPPLPIDKTKVIECMAMGLIDKIVMTFPVAWWPKNVNFFAFMWKSEDTNVAKEDFWTTKIFMASTPLGSSKSLTLWTNGDMAKLVETLPEDLVKRKCMDVLKRFIARDIEIPEPISIIRTKWYTNPYTRGSYTFDNLLVADYPNARKILSEPLTDSDGKPRVMFAGEATHSRHFSTVHGAAETGYREAMRILPKSSKL